MKKYTKALISSVCAAVMFAGAAMPASACDLTPEELFEKYSDNYRLVDYGGTYYVEPASELFLTHYDSDGNYLGPLQYMDNPYRIRYNIASKEFHPDYNCEFEDGFYYAIKDDGTATIAGCDYDYLMERTPTAIRIPEKIGGAVVTEIAQYAFYRSKWYMTELTSVSIPDTVEVIRFGAFDAVFCDNTSDCDRYIDECSINIPQNVKYIGGISFGHQTSLAFGDEIVLPESLEFLNETAFTTVFGNVKNRVQMPKSLVFFLHGRTYLPKTYAELFVGGKGNCVTIWDVRDYLLSNMEQQEQKSAAALPAGDLNANDEHDLSDAILLARAVGGSYELSAAERAAADLNGDNAVDAADLSALLAILAGK